jgi:membrane-bound lytic murein transglycosylase B
MWFVAVSRVLFLLAAVAGCFLIAGCASVPVARTSDEPVQPQPVAQAPAPADGAGAAVADPRKSEESAPVVRQEPRPKAASTAVRTRSATDRRGTAVKPAAVEAPRPDKPGRPWWWWMVLVLIIAFAGVWAWRSYRRTGTP